MQAAQLGCKSIQFIGGEPTVHPQLNQFIRLATELGMRVEVYTNLVSIKQSHWQTFQDCGVNIATSFYTAKPEIHEEITQGKSSWKKTVDNIQTVLNRGLPLRVGLVEMRPDQDIDETQQFLQQLGVTRVRVDHTRGVGRGAELVQITPRPEDELCGACARGRAAIIPDGRVFPCVFSRHLTIGNVLQNSLEDIILGERMGKTRAQLTLFFRSKFPQQQCMPDDCGPNTSCSPESGHTPKMEFPCMPATEPYLATQNLSELQNWCEPHECDPNCEPGECNPDLCQPSHTCIPDFKDPCTPAQPCSPDEESCAPEWNKCGPDDR
ncbi:hypothetical protein KDW_31280 [Dictyobacter vulcani]|uniref:Radical SAM core domain-containing protein n=2 Tax=Dictyobacter vulcani TaxID=2607529 RepID=A0A5J4KUQ3_9CHLR|nr:hypothetical protein KDW_31280 [Dictyobacter vulcani]